ncbi:MAG: cyclic nucleotide-binding domain-containing protein [Candidatus Hydrogenedentes bacterium]|nr:cyclic nucleotide-binding domain-containing protein [Candidatus Hydrogenedentota bacterium]
MLKSESATSAFDDAVAAAPSGVPGERRLTRWARPFGEMSDADIVGVLRYDPFRSICADLEEARKPQFVSFGVPVSIHGILKNDARIRRYRPGEFAVRKDDYGNSAFFVLEGELRAVLQPDLPAALLGHRERVHVGVVRSFGRRVRDMLFPPPAEYRAPNPKARSLDEQGVVLDAKELAAVLDPAQYQTAPLRPGAFFGEIGAIYRMPRELSIVASAETRLLEIRWQGLRDLMEADEGIARHIDDMYRKRSLKGALEAIPHFNNLPDDVLDQVQFTTYGKYDEWSSEYIGLSAEEKTHVIEQEEIIVQEGDYPNGVHVVRAGFARESKRYGHGHRTLNYLASGQVFGIKEVLYNWQHPNHPIPFQHSLRAIGYAHILTIPTHLVEKYVLPVLLKEQPNFPRYRSKDIRTGNTEVDSTLRDDIGAGLFEFLAENRVLNGTRTMLINLDRCTRCDDCVRGCAAAHDNNPRFVRHGPIHGNIMVANSCMHCADPVCMIGCPTGAISRESLEGQVVINEDTCIGCATCFSNCPYDAIRMITVRNRRGEFRIATSGEAAGAPIYKATKCDFCVDHTGGPACVRACPHDALQRVNMQNVDELARFLKR